MNSPCFLWILPLLLVAIPIVFYYGVDELHPSPIFIKVIVLKVTGRYRAEMKTHHKRLTFGRKE